MNREQFKAAYRAYCKRRPFRSFVVKLNTGRQIVVGHPEAVREEGQLLVLRATDGKYVIFAPETVSSILDP